MLGKLLKHEFIATGRALLLVFASVIAVAALTSLLGLALRPADISVPLSTSDLMLTVIIPPLVLVNLTALGAALIVPFIVIVVRFYRNFLMAEGYLMFTLPVTRHQLILSKLIVAAVWYVVAWIVTTASAVIALAGWIPADYWAENMWLFNALFTGLTQHFDQGGLMFAMYIISMGIGTFSGALMVYFAMGLGQLANAHRVLLSIVTYFALLVGTFVMTIMVTLPISLTSSLNSSVTDTQIFQETIISLAVSNVLSLVLAVAMYFGTEYLLRKRLNLL